MYLDPQKGRAGTVTITSANHEYEFAIEAEAQDLYLALTTATAWRYSFTKGDVAGGGGTSVPVAAGGTVYFKGPFLTEGQTLYVACGSSSKVLAANWTRPARRG